jgi:hypothetical protein
MQDHDVTLYFKRADSSQAALGNADFHREMVTQALGL